MTTDRHWDRALDAIEASSSTAERQAVLADMIDLCRPMLTQVEHELAGLSDAVRNTGVQDSRPSGQLLEDATAVRNELDMLIPLLEREAPTRQG